MKRQIIERVLVVAAATSLGCTGGGPLKTEVQSEIQQRLAKYISVRLTADLSELTENQRRLIPLLIEAADAMDEAFWLQAYGDKQHLLGALADPDERRFAEINYGPWDRLADNEPFIAGAGDKPQGARFYPVGMTKEQFEAAAAVSEERAEALMSLYTMIRRNAAGDLVVLPYHETFATQVEHAAAKLRAASELAEDPGFKRYLELRARALVTDDYQPSDLAWMDMKENAIDVVIGPIETYEDDLYGYKAAYEAYVLLKDRNWSERLAKYATMLPDLQRGLPVPDEYKAEKPGTESDLNAYDVVYSAGDCNAGSKTIAINLPNDEEVQLQKGTRRLQLKNAMRAKFDKILRPITEVLIAEDQRRHVTFDAFFANTMFHEVAHGLGIKNTLDGKGTVRQAMKNHASALEEGKADVLGVYMVTRLHESGELENTTLEDHYVTFMAGIFRAVRFGASSAHGRANMIRFNFFQKMDAFERDERSGIYRVHMDRMKQAIDALSEKILRFQGDGDYQGVEAWVQETGSIGGVFQADLDRLSTAGIPVDIVFEQGTGVLGLE
jgi:hypothetical protein